MRSNPLFDREDMRSIFSFGSLAQKDRFNYEQNSNGRIEYRYEEAKVSYIALIFLSKIFYNFYFYISLEM